MRRLAASTRTTPPTLAPLDGCAGVVSGRVVPVAREMVDTIDSPILDLLEWTGPEPLPYAEVLDAWRTSCPRLTVWEDANDRGFIARHRAPGRGALVAVTAAGTEYLRAHRRQSW
jgi:hypothetical protein